MRFQEQFFLNHCKRPNLEEISWSSWWERSSRFSTMKCPCSFFLDRRINGRERRKNLSSHQQRKMKRKKMKKFLCRREESLETDQLAFTHSNFLKIFKHGRVGWLGDALVELERQRMNLLNCSRIKTKHCSIFHASRKMSSLYNNLSTMLTERVKKLDRFLVIWLGRKVIMRKFRFVVPVYFLSWSNASAVGIWFTGGVLTAEPKRFLLAKIKLHV